MAHMGFPKTRGSFPGFPQGLQVRVEFWFCSMGIAVRFAINKVPPRVFCFPQA